VITNKHSLWTCDCFSSSANSVFIRYTGGREHTDGGARLTACVTGASLCRHWIVAEAAMWGDFADLTCSGTARASNTIRAQVPVPFCHWGTAHSLLQIYLASLQMYLSGETHLGMYWAVTDLPSSPVGSILVCPEITCTCNSPAPLPYTWHIHMRSLCSQSTVRFTHAGALFWYSCIPQLPHCRSERLSPSRRKTAGILPMLCSLAATRLLHAWDAHAKQLYRRLMLDLTSRYMDLGDSWHCWLRLKWFAVRGRLCFRTRSWATLVVLPDRVDASPVRCMHRRSCDTVHVCLSHAFQSSSPLVDQAYTAREVLRCCRRYSWVITAGCYAAGRRSTWIDRHAQFDYITGHFTRIWSRTALRITSLSYGTVVLRPLRLRLPNG
jgi:hypothetical protein